MVKKKRGRCVKKNVNINLEPDEIVQAPHSFVIHKGLPGGNIMELTKDFRKVMEPFTAKSLKERKKNSIKDFVSIAGPLHVSHLTIFSRTELGMYMKIMRLPRGPTLTFKLYNFSLARDVISSAKKQLVVEEAFKHSPLIVLNSFSGEGMQMKLMASMFQNMFPTINLTAVNLNTVRRCVLLNYNPTTKHIDLRHYNIKVAPVGISKGVKKVVQGKVPNLSKCNDISEFFTQSGMMSESEAEDDSQHHVILAHKIVSRGNIESGKSAIRLNELGPRLTLQLVKIEDGLLDGEVLFHELIHKTEEEKAEIQKKRNLKQKLKENRKKIQETNKKKKYDAKELLKEKSLIGMRKGISATDHEIKISSKESLKEAPVEEDDDREYYRQEVGEEPDKDLFTSKSGIKRKFRHPEYPSKKLKLTNPENYVKNSFTSSKSFDQKKNVFDYKGKKFNKNMACRSKFGKGYKGKGFDKTNSHNRDHRPIGGRFGAKSKIGRNTK